MYLQLRENCTDFVNNVGNFRSNYIRFACAVIASCSRKSCHVLEFRMSYDSTIGICKLYFAPRNSLHQCVSLVFLFFNHSNLSVYCWWWPLVWKSRVEYFSLVIQHSTYLCLHKLLSLYVKSEFVFSRVEAHSLFACLVNKHRQKTRTLCHTHCMVHWIG